MDNEIKMLLDIEIEIRKRLNSIFLFVFCWKLIESEDAGLLMLVRCFIPFWFQFEKFLYGNII